MLMLLLEVKEKHQRKIDKLGEKISPFSMTIFHCKIMKQLEYNSPASSK